jgi:3-methylcrotonyl-CoA carboxylase alpha subunit
VTGLDIVGLQLRLARGDDLSDELDASRIGASGHAIECRICAENPAKMFLPQPGPLTTLSFPPEGPSLRVDTGVRQGDAVTPFYDSMIAKLIVHAPTRDEAIEAARAALAGTTVGGIAANVGFLGRVLDHPSFRSGRTLTRFIDDHKSDLLG